MSIKSPADSLQRATVAQWPHPTARGPRSRLTRYALTSQTSHKRPKHHHAPSPARARVPAWWRLLLLLLQTCYDAGSASASGRSGPGGGSGVGWGGDAAAPPGTTSECSPPSRASEAGDRARGSWNGTRLSERRPLR